MSLPPELLAAIVSEGGGKVVLVLGAGCSVESPTDLPLARDCAVDAHRRLVADGVLGAGDCANPEDLSAVADIVHAQRGSQRELVLRLPTTAFQNATPNEGYLIAAALLREQALGSLLTLNFDLAMGHALAAVRAGEEIAVLKAPQDHHRMGVVGVVHLHGDATSDAEDWILRSEQLEGAWRDGWQDLITTRILTAPVVVFVGLGSPASVLVESVERIRQAMEHVVIHVDSAPYGSSDFTAAVGVLEERYVELPWCRFMEELGDRVATEQIASLKRSVDVFVVRERYDEADCSDILTELENAGLLNLGRIRAGWLLEGDSYLPARGADSELLAVLVYGVALACGIASWQVSANDAGNLELRRDGRLVGYLVPASGKATRSWASVESALQATKRLRQPRGFEPVIVLTSGVLGERPPLTAPRDLVAEQSADSIVAPNAEPIVVDLEELRTNPDGFLQALGA